MLVICDNCQREMNVPAAVGSSRQGKKVRVRCSCGHSFTPDLAEPRRVLDHPDDHPELTDPEGAMESAESSGDLAIPLDDEVSDPIGALPPAERRAAVPAPPVPAPRPESEPNRLLLIKQEGKIFRVPDMAALQQWIAQSRVLPADLFSQDGIRWDVIGQQPELQSFFRLVEQARLGESAMASNVRPPTPPEEGWSGVDEPTWEESGPIPSPDDDSTPGGDRVAPLLARQTVEPPLRPEPVAKAAAPVIDLGYRSGASARSQAPADTRDRPSSPQIPPPPPRPVAAPQAVERPPLRLTPTQPEIYPVPTPNAEPPRLHARPPRSPLVPVLMTLIVIILCVAGILYLMGKRQGAGPPPSSLAQNLPEPRPEPVETLVSIESPPPTSNVVTSAPKKSPSQGNNARRTDDPGAASTAAASASPESASKTSVGSGSSKVYVRKGWEAVEQKSYDKARQAFVDAAALNPKDGWAWYGLGYAAEKQGDARTAQSSYCKARGVAGNNVDLQREVEGRISSGKYSCP